MATIGNQSIGDLKILLKQGNTQTIRLKFSNLLPDDSTEPIDLTQYEAIKMQVKSQINVNLTPLITWTVGSGLTIEGDDNEILSFTFNQELLQTDFNVLYYDILFTETNGKTTLIGGEISNRKVVTS